MDELRVILLLIGAAILAAIYFFSRPRKPNQARSGEGRGSREAPEERAEPSLRSDARDEPPTETMSRELKRLGELISRDHGGGGRSRKKPKRQDEGGAPAPAESPRKQGERESTGKREKPEQPEADRIVVLYVKARGEHRISGPRLIEAAKKAGLEYGDMEIYHRLDESGQREPIFSMANMVAPGTLDQTQSPEFATPGVALFMRLPGPLGALDAWDTMLATARRMAELLDAEMLDENHSSLNRQRIQQIREDMREYDRLSTLEIRKK